MRRIILRAAKLLVSVEINIACRNTLGVAELWYCWPPHYQCGERILLLAAIVLVQQTTNIAGRRLSKLSLGAAAGISALGGRLGLPSCEEISTAGCQATVFCED